MIKYEYSAYPLTTNSSLTEDTKSKQNDRFKHGAQSPVRFVWFYISYFFHNINTSIVFNSSLYNAQHVETTSEKDGKRWEEMEFRNRWASQRCWAGTRSRGTGAAAARRTEWRPGVPLQHTHTHTHCLASWLQETASCVLQFTQASYLCASCALMRIR
jgi:5-methylcytosine-specific restriction endonuclease McrA